MSYRIASRYAKSLIDLAMENGKFERVLEDINGFVKATKNRDLLLLLKSPLVKPEKKASVMDALFKEKIDPLTHAFMQIIIRKGREALLPEIAQEFLNQYREIKGISIVNIVSAQPLDDSTIEAIRKKLLDSKLTRGTIQFNTSIDKELIGGFVISFEDKLYDASVQHQLNELRKQFSSKEYQVAI